MLELIQDVLQRDYKYMANSDIVFYESVMKLRHWTRHIRHPSITIIRREMDVWLSRLDGKMRLWPVSDIIVNNGRSLYITVPLLCSAFSSNTAVKRRFDEQHPYSEFVLNLTIVN